MGENEQVKAFTRVFVCVCVSTGRIIALEQSSQQKVLKVF